MLMLLISLAQGDNAIVCDILYDVNELDRHNLREISPRAGLTEYGKSALKIEAVTDDRLRVGGFIIKRFNFQPDLFLAAFEPETSR